MFTEKDLIAGETVLVSKDNPTDKRLYLGNAGFVHFISVINKYEEVGICFTIKDIIKHFDIEQPKSKVVPLEKKVYDFVPVRVRNMVSVNWENRFLIAVIPGAEYPFKTVDEDGDINTYKYCEFLNEQP